MPECARCGDPFWPEQDGQKYCSVRCREAAKKRRTRFRARFGHSREVTVSPVSHADHDEDAGVFYGDEDQGDEQAERFHSMLQADADSRAPRDAWRVWRTYGRRHGVEHPEATADRIERHRTAEAARMARIDTRTAGRVQDRFDTRTTASVAQNAIQSRALNARHVEQPPPASRSFDFHAESVNGSFYRQGRPAGQRAGHADYAWQMQDGFTF